MENGQYYVDVSLEGGSGRATVQSPALLEVNDEGMLAELVWSSTSYDKMVVEGAEYFPLEGADTACFRIPVKALDTEIPVSAETVAMSRPHLIDYTLYFDSESLQKAGSSPMPFLFIGGAVLLVLAIAAGVLLWRRRRKRKEKSQ